MTKDEMILYELQCLASYTPEDLDYPEFEVAYEAPSGEESFATVCIVEFARRLETRFAELINQDNKGEKEIMNRDYCESYTSDRGYTLQFNNILRNPDGDIICRAEEIKPIIDKLNELQDFAIWMSGVTDRFGELDYFKRHRHLLGDELNQDNKGDNDA